MTTPGPTASATIERGKKTNRVRLVKRHASRGRPRKERKVQRVAPQEAQRNPSGAYVVISISLYPDDLVAMDELAARVQMSRSALIRRAVERFAVAVAPGAEQEQRWKDAMR